jgi:hypothetical protein
MFRGDSILRYDNAHVARGFEVDVVARIYAACGALRVREAVGGVKRGGDGRGIGVEEVACVDFIAF